MHFRFEVRKLKKRRDVHISTPNLYKILAKMLDHQMLAKRGERLTLSDAWVAHLCKYTRLMEKPHQMDERLFSPFNEGDRRTFFAESLNKIEYIWGHLIFNFFTKEKNKHIYVYKSHPLYLLGKPERERRIYESLGLKGKKLHILYGGNTFLDRHVQKTHKMSFCQYSYIQEPPFPKEAYTLWMCGDNMIEGFLPDVINQYFTFFFQTVTCIEDFNRKAFTDAFDIKATVELNVSRDSKKAKKLLKLFKVHI